jgi:hypothetical protein
MRVNKYYISGRLTQPFHSHFPLFPGVDAPGFLFTAINYYKACKRFFKEKNSKSFFEKRFSYLFFGYSISKHKVGDSLFTTPFSFGPAIAGPFFVLIFAKCQVLLLLLIPVFQLF